MLDSMSLDDMQAYLGRDCVVDGFDAFWKAEISKIDISKIKIDFIERHTHLDFVDCYDLFFEARDGRIHAKILLPKNKKNIPTIFEFHGYQGQSPDWSDAFNYVAAGYGMVMMDVRGQSGESDDFKTYKGNTVKGQVIRGAEQSPDDLFFKEAYLDVYTLIEIISNRDEVDSSRLYSYGGSQGGALALVAAALNTRIKKVFAIYPFLSDFKRVLELKLDSEPYDELHRYFKFSDPFGDKSALIFNNLGFIDLKNFAHLIQADVQIVTCLRDDTCPPSTQFAIYNRLKCPKEMKILTEYGHESINVKMNDFVFDWLTGSTIL